MRFKKFHCKYVKPIIIICFNIKFRQLYLLFNSIFPISIILGDLFLNLNSVLISIVFLIFLYKFDELKLINNKYYYPFYILLLLFLLVQFFLIILLSPAENLLSFFSQLTLFACLVYFLNKNKKYTLKLSKIIFIIVALICIDLWIQKLFGKNIFGYEQQQAGRLTSFLKKSKFLEVYSLNYHL